MLSVDTIYVQVYATRFVVRNIDSDQSIEVNRDQTHASPRMLIADFTTAKHQLTGALKSVRRGIRAPEILIQPMERIDGGITQVEYKVFVELGVGAGASKVGVYAGSQLSREGVKKAIHEYRH